MDEQRRIESFVFPGTAVIGLVGGMGPQAGVGLYNSILRHTKAVTDQQHLDVILMSFPGWLPDRTKFLEGAVAENPAYAIAAILCKLEAAGAETAGIACNTAYAPEIYDVVLEELERMGCRIRLLHMPEETCHYIAKEYPFFRRIGLMTTNGTYRSGVYRRMLENLGYEVILPDITFQDSVIHRMVYDPVDGIKATPQGISRMATQLAEKAWRYFAERHAEAVILGCTELSLMAGTAFPGNAILVDSTDCLARALIRTSNRTVAVSKANSISK